MDWNNKDTRIQFGMIMFCAGMFTAFILQTLTGA